MKFYQRHHVDWAQAALGVELNRIRTLASIVTYSSHRVIKGKTVLPLFRDCFAFNPFLYLPGNDKIYESTEQFEIPDQIRPWADEIDGRGRLKTFP